MKQPKVYISILNWNGLKDTLDCLDSVFKLDYPNFEVIVVDNGSIDDSVEILAKTYPQVTLIKNKENLGFVGGNNIGMRYAMECGADYLWLLNNDTVVEKDSLGKIVNMAEQESTIGLVSPLIYYHDRPDIIQFCGSYIDWVNCRVEHARDLESWRSISSQESISLWGTALLIKKSLIQDIGYLNDDYFAYHEDCEYSIRALRKGYRNFLEPAARVYHKDSRSTGGKQSPMQVFLRIRNSYFLWMRNLRGLSKWKYFGKFIGDTISYKIYLENASLSEAADACCEAAWFAIRGIGGSWNRRITAPTWFRKLFTFFATEHPYFWVNLFRSNYSAIIPFFTGKSKRKITNTSK